MRLKGAKVLMLFMLLLLQLSFYSQADTMSCKMLYRRIHQMKYDEVKQEIQSGADCDCFYHTTHTGKGPAPKFWRPGWLIETIFHSFSPARTSTESHSLISETLYMPVTPGRDSLLTFLIESTDNYNHLMNDWPLKRYMNHSMKKFNAELFELMYQSADSRHKDAAIETAIRLKCNPFLSRYINDKQWGDRGVDFLQDLVCSDTVDLVTEIWSRGQISPNAKTKVWKNTLLHLIVHGARSGKCQPTIKQKEKLFNSMVENQYNFNRNNRQGETPLEIAIRKNDLDFMPLLATKSDLKRLTKKHQTYLHLAVIYNREELVKQLIDLGIDLNRKDKEGKRAVEYSKGFQVEIRKMLGAPVDPKLDKSQFLQRMNLKDSLTDDEKNEVMKIVQNEEYYYSFINHKGVEIPALAEQSIRGRNAFMTFQLMTSRKIVLSEEAKEDLMDWYEECLEVMDIETLQLLNQVNYGCVEKNIAELYSVMQRCYFGYRDRDKEKPRMGKLLHVLNESGNNPVLLSGGRYTINFTGKQFDSIVQFPHVPLLKVKQNDKWGILDPYLNEVVACQYDFLKLDTSVNGYQEVYSLLLAQQGNDFHLITLKFDEEYQVYEKHVLPDCTPVKLLIKNYKLLIWTQRNDLTGLSVLSNGKMTIIYPPIYQEVRLLPQAVLAVKNEGKWSLQYSREYADLKFKWMEYKVENDTIYVRKKRKWKEFKK